MSGFKEKGYMSIEEFVKEFGLENVKYLKKIEDLPEGTGIRISPTVSLEDGNYRFQPETREVPGLTTLIGDHKTIISNLNVYVEVNSYTITKVRGFLQTLSIYSDQPVTADWRITITRPDETVDTLFAGEKLPITLTITWGDNNGKGVELRPGAIIKIEIDPNTVNTTAAGVIIGTEEE